MRGLPSWNSVHTLPAPAAGAWLDEAADGLLDTELGLLPADSLAADGRSEFSEPAGALAEAVLAVTDTAFGAGGRDDPELPAEGADWRAEEACAGCCARDGEAPAERFGVDGERCRAKASVRWRLRGV